MKNYNKYIAKTIHYRTVTTDMLAVEISNNCCVKRSDLLACLCELSEVLLSHLKSGDIVKIDGIGSFKLEMDCLPANTPEEFSESNILGVHCVFRPEKKNGVIKMYQDIDFGRVNTSDSKTSDSKASDSDRIVSGGDLSVPEEKSFRPKIPD